MRGRDFRMVVYNAAASGNLPRIKIFVDPNKESKEWINDCLNSDFNAQFPLVIAARKGHLDIVEYLHKVGADPSVSGSVEFDNDDILGTPPLWAACAAGHFKIVRYLVENANADVNQTTETQSTPLRGACYDGHLEIVKYLLEKGANINTPNRHGHTSLMIAAYRNKIDVVKHLIEKNADINIQTSKGNSALHDAAESGNTEIVELLIKAGAKLSKDFQGVCPLLCAAQSGHPEVVEVLIDQVTSNILKRDAYKLLGCTLVDKKMDSELAIKYWRKSLEMDMTPEEWGTISEWETFTEPLEVYDNKMEVHRIWDFDEVAGNMDTIRMQSLIIRERILGGAHTDVHYYLRFRGAVYCDLGQMNKCYALWRHALELQQKHFSPLHIGTVTTLQSFQETFGMTLNDYVNAQHVDRSLRVNSWWVHYVFDKVCYELERVHEWGDKPLMHSECCGDDTCKHTTIENEKKKLVVTALQLVNVLERLSLPSANGIDIDDKIGELDVSRLVAICDKLHLPILHYSLEETSGDGGDYMTLPKASVVQILLEHRIDPTLMDSDGNSPIHILLNASMIRRSLIRLMLDSGALVFSSDRDGKVIFEELSKLNKADMARDLPIGRYMTLAGITASFIRRKMPDLLENVQLSVNLSRFLTKH